MVKVKQINNLQIKKDTENNIYYAIAPNNMVIYKGGKLSEIEELCKRDKSFLKAEKGETRVVKLALRETAYKAGTDDTYMYEVVVPKTVTNAEIKRVLDEANYLLNAVHEGNAINGKGITKEKVDRALYAHRNYYLGINAMICYIVGIYHWEMSVLNLKPEIQYHVEF